MAAASTCGCACGLLDPSALTANANNSMQVTSQKAGFSVSEPGGMDGIVAVQVTGLPIYHDTNGIVRVAVTTPTNGIGWRFIGLLVHAAWCLNRTSLGPLSLWQ